MSPQSATQHSDALLSLYLHETSDAESESLLTRLLEEQASPVIKRIIGSKLHGFGGADRLRWQDGEDVYGEVVTQLLERLRACKTNAETDVIHDFLNYVAVTTYNACHEYLRSKYPQRWRLKNRVRYVLTHQPEFGMWQSGEGNWLCGFAAWSTRAMDHPAGKGLLQQISDAPQSLALAADKTYDIKSASLTDLLHAIFRKVGTAIELEALVNSVADLQGIKDMPFASNPEEDHISLAASSDSRTEFAVEVEYRSYLQRLWVEIIQLPVSQRIALLLNLRDVHEGVIMLLPLTGVATIRQIAEAVSIPAQEFAKLWKDLPLDDTAVALRLGVTRQQVINLRKSARARLSRRMRPL
jgi:hypothetical protein